MSNPGTPSIQLLPSITGNQAYDRLIRSFLVAASGGLTAWILAWLKARGYSDPNMDILVSGAVFSALTTIAVMVWGFVNGQRSEAAAKEALTIGVKAGIAHAEDTSSPTVPLAAVSPEVAKAIVADYAPATKS